MAGAAFKAIVSRGPPLLPSLLVPIRGIVSKLFVGGLSFHTTEKTLAEAFSQYGQVIEAKIVTERDLDKSKGFGFVTFASQDEAEKAIEEMSGKALDGRVIFVDIAKADQRSLGSPYIIARGPPGFEASSTESSKKGKKVQRTGRTED